MLFDAKEKWMINFSKSYLIGDSLIDKQCAENADIPFIMISGHGDLNTAVECIKKGAFGPLIRTRATCSAVSQGISDLV